MKCHCCESENLIKYGKSANKKQRYMCKVCSSISVEDPEHVWLSEFEKKLILKLTKEGMSIRAIARVVERDFKSIFSFLKKNIQNVS